MLQFLAFCSTCFMLVFATGAYANPKPVCFVGIYADESQASVHESFANVCGRPDFVAQVQDLIRDVFETSKTFALRQDDDVMQGSFQETQFLRMVVFRADVTRIQRYAWPDDQVAVGVRVEFVNPVSGEVIFVRSLTGRTAWQTTSIDAIKREQAFQTCFFEVVHDLLKAVAQDYVPDTRQGKVVDIHGENLVFTLKKADGLHVGSLVEVKHKSEAIGIYKITAVQNRISIGKKVVADQQPVVGDDVVFATNAEQNRFSGPRFMVSGVSLHSKFLPESISGLTSAEMGQWLHDNLVNETELAFIDPIFVGVNANKPLSVEPLWESQVALTQKGFLSQTETIGHRLLPDVIVRGVLAYLKDEVHAIPAGQLHLLKGGLAVEFYDRKTREFLYALQRNYKRIEKIVVRDDKTYRNANLDGAFRELLQDLCRQVAVDIGKHYQPARLKGRVQEINTNKGFVSAKFDHPVFVGDRFMLMNKGDMIQDLDGRDLEPVYVQTGVVLVRRILPSGNVLCEIVASNGSSVSDQDELWVDGRVKNEAPSSLFQVTTQPIDKNIRDEFQCTSEELAEWIHDALIQKKMRLMPPAFRDSDQDVIDLSLAMGQFEAVGSNEIIYQDIRRPDVVVLGRLGLGDVHINYENQFKNQVAIRTGVEITLKTLMGDTLNTQKLVGKRKLEQLKSRDKIRFGTLKFQSAFVDLTKDVIDKIVGSIVANQ
jgi:hypothetical protein